MITRPFLQRFREKYMEGYILLLKFWHLLVKQMPYKIWYMVQYYWIKEETESIPSKTAFIIILKKIYAMKEISDWFLDILYEHVEKFLFTHILTTESFKNDEKPFLISCSKLFAFIIFIFWLFGYVEKHLDKMFKVDFKINRTTNNYSKHIRQYLKK